MPSTAALALAVTLNDKASKGLNNIGKEGGGLGRVFGALLGPTALVAAGIGALGAGLGLAAKAAAEEQVGVERLSQALKNSVPDWQTHTKEVDAAIKAAEGKAFSDDAARKSMALLVGVTKDVGEANKAMTAAMDLARLKGISLEESTGILISAFGGKTKALEKMGVELKKGADDTAILTAVQKLAGGQADTYANTTAGAMDRIKTTFGNIVETLGAKVLEVIQGPLKGFADFISSPEFMAGLEGFVELLGTGLKAALDLIGPPIAAAAEQIGKLFGALTSGDADQVKTFFTDIGGPIGTVGLALSGAFDNAQSFFSVFLGDGANTGKEYFNELSGDIEKMKTPSDEFWASVKQWIDGNIIPATDAFQRQWDQFWADNKTDLEENGGGWDKFWAKTEASFGQFNTRWTDFWAKTKTSFGISDADWDHFWLKDKTEKDKHTERWSTYWTSQDESQAANFSKWDEYWRVTKENFTAYGLQWDAYWETTKANFTEFGAGWDAFWVNLGLEFERWRLAWDAFWANLNFETISNKAKEIGRGIIDGIINGINEAKHKLMDAAREIADSLPQWVKDLLGIKSPSTVFAGIGDMMMVGWAQGIERSAPLVANALRGAYNGLPLPSGGGFGTGGGIPLGSPFGGTSGGRGGGGLALEGGGGGITLIVNAGIGTDGRHVGQEILETLSHQLGLHGRNVSHRGI